MIDHNGHAYTSFLNFIDCNQELLNLALVQYAFDGVEHSVIPRPHGNSKKGDSYIRTMPSTMHKLKKVAVNLTPKFAVCEVSGDVLSAPSAGSLVRNRQQAKDLRRRKDEGQLVPVGKTKDPLFSVMLMCKESQGAKASDAFIRIVTCAPEPMAVLASDWTLNDLDRFCTKQHCTVFCIDPTFSLGDFSVTVTTYRHLMLCNSNEKHPVMMGPILIHKQKKFESYHFFASSLVGLKPSLRSLKVFGTDGEKAISNAMHVVFERAVHLRCFLHFKGNLDMKLREYGVPKSERMEFLRDVFGNPLELETGLVDAESEQEFEALVESVKDVWEQRESPYNSPPQFHSWFVKYCKDEVKDTMLKSKRIECGLGNPPEPFYTNDVESQNQVIKHQTQYKAKELPDFIATMQTMITNQKQEIERAVVGVGEYQLVDEYKHLKIPTRKFCQMTQMQKDKHLRSFFSSPLADSVQSEHEEEQKIESSQGENSNRITSSVPLNPLLQLDIPSHIAEKIWKEAEELLKSNPSKICLSPGCTESNEWLVKSSEQNHRHPYFVEIKDSGQILCEKSCMLYSSCKMCSHTVAVAYHTKSSQRYLKWMQKQKGSVSLSVLANANMPKGAGKKPNARRKASSKSATKRIKELIAEADSEQLTPRIKPSIKELTSSDEHNLMRTPALSDDMPGPSELSFSYSYPPPLRPAKSTWSPPSSSDYNQPLDHFGRQPPPLVSTGSLVQQVSMAYSPSANVVYAPVVSMSSSVDKDTFWLQFVRGNILRCNGCGKRDLRGEDGRPKPQPYDLCIQHKEHVLFENPHTGMYQMSADLRNVYYHARLQCVTQKNVHFNPGSALKISQEVKSKLSKVHFAYLLGEFGLSFLNQ